jgi:ABC-2 type transport system ATP-binding protein
MDDCGEAIRDPLRDGEGRSPQLEGRMTTNAIAMDGLTKHFPGVQALTDLTLEVPAGSIYGFLGPNGAGKTTALRMLAGLSRPTRGTAAVAGISIDAGAAYRQVVGYLAQEPRYYPWMTGRETISFVGDLYPRASRPDRKRVDEMIDLVGLGDAADRKVGTYSGGMRQRLGIAQALVARPAVLLLDEPVSSLDPIGRREVLELMQRTKSEATIFYSTHILDDVERISDYVAILDHGHLVRAQPTAELLASFTRDQLHVVLGGADDDTAVALAGLAGVASVELSGRDAASRSYRLRVEPGAGADVQRSLTRFAAEHDLTLIDNSVAREGLEDVFLRLVDTKEHAA